MDRRFAKFTEITFDYHDKSKPSNELMVDTSQILAIRETDSWTEIIIAEENFCVIESFEEVRKILAI
nr:MAG TPA: hypothetical protein [Crassvirales sp.]